jgi:molecular chaperone IbpA
MTNQLSIRSTDIPHLLPQLSRFGVGFDRMFDRLEELQRQTAGSNTGYPPFNMVKITEDQYQIELAVAGFSEGEINLTVKENQLTIEGKHVTDEEEQAKEYVHRGIGARDFFRTFTLAEYVEVTGASQMNGILTIDLARIVPDEAKPKTIEIAYKA